MIFCIHNGKRISPKKEFVGTGFKGICPACGSSVHAKCGNLNAWHWSHIDAADCKYFDHPETPWHLGWKTLFPEDFIEKGIRNRIADVLINGHAVEFQTQIGVDDILNRTGDYPNTVWVINCRKGEDPVKRKIITDSISVAINKQRQHPDFTGQRLIHFDLPAVMVKKLDFLKDINHRGIYVRLILDIGQLIDGIGDIILAEVATTFYIPDENRKQRVYAFVSTQKEFIKSLTDSPPSTILVNQCKAKTEVSFLPEGVIEENDIES